MNLHKIKLLLISMGLFNVAFSQNKLPNYAVNFGKGIQFVSADSSFTMAINGRIQTMYEGKYELSESKVYHDFILRRCRLNIQGSAISPKLTYRIQLGFGHGDITSGNSTVQNNLILRDAMLYYAPKKWIKLGFGQTKLPGNRQRMVSSGNLQLVERSIINNNFTLDRDKGVWLFNYFNIGKSQLKSTIALSSGEGRIVSDKNGKICLSSRLEYLPFGEFSSNGDYMESDLAFEKKPKLSIALAYSRNNASPRTLGQLGDYLYNNVTSNIIYYGADFLFKYKGFSLQGEWYNRESNTGVIVNKKDTLQKNFVLTGRGYFIQSGYLITSKDEIAVRFGRIDPSKSISAVYNIQKEHVVGYSHYFSKHNLKIQSDLSWFMNGTKSSFVKRISCVITF